MSEITIRVGDRFYHGTYDGFWFRSYSGALVCVPLREHLEAGEAFDHIQPDPEAALFGGQTLRTSPQA